MEYQLLKVAELQPFPIRDIRANVVEKLRDRIKEGYNPARPLSVVKDNGNYIVADGNHRLEVLKQLNVAEVPCLIREGNPYSIAVECNQDEDTYAPMDLFDWLDVIGKLKGEGLTQAAIGDRVGWSRDKVQGYSEIANKIVAQVLETVKEHQDDRATSDVAVVTFNFTEGWFRSSGLYELKEYPERQSQAVTEFLVGVNIKQRTKKLLEYEDMIKYTGENLLDDELAGEVLDNIENGLYKNTKALAANIEKINARWQEKNNVRIIHGDCFEQHIEAESVDLVLTDPPYNYSRDNNFASMDRAGIDFGEWDKVDDYPALLQKIADKTARVLKPGGSFYIFVGEPDVTHLWDALLGAGLTPKRVMHWDKANPIPTNQDRLFLAATESFIWGTKGDGWTFNGSYCKNIMQHSIPKDRIHPTEKPEGLITKLVEVSSNIGEVVFDMFGGSCVTARVCKALKRQCICIERDAGYVKKANARMAGV